MESALIIAAAFLLGSIPFAVVIAKIAGLGDITKHGSGNPGATNMARLGGKKLAALNLLLDAAKGALAVYIGQLYGLAEIAFIAVVYGHCFSIFLRFKGGKGVATTIGAALLLNLHIGLTICALWAVTYMIFRISSLAALVAVGLTTLKIAIWYHSEPILWTFICVALLVIFKHRNNISRLIAGTEK